MLKLAKLQDPQVLRTLAVVLAVAVVFYGRLSLKTMARVALTAVIVVYGLGASDGLKHAALTAWLVLLVLALVNDYVLPKLGFRLPL